MNLLTTASCEACKKSSPLLSTSELNSLLPEIADWQLINDHNINKLQQVFSTQTYPKAVKFTLAIAELAEQQGHHPKITLEYAQVTVQWWTHIIHGLHKNDIIMAAKTSDVFQKLG